MENYRYSKEEIRFEGEFWDGNKSEAESFCYEGFSFGPSAPAVEKTPEEVANETKKAAEMDAINKAYVEYWTDQFADAKPSDPPMHRPMQAPGHLSNYVEEDAFDHPENPDPRRRRFEGRWVLEAQTIVWRRRMGRRGGHCCCHGWHC